MTFNLILPNLIRVGDTGWVGGQPWWWTILFSVPWTLHFEIHFAGHVNTFKFTGLGLITQSLHIWTAS